MVVIINWDFYLSSYFVLNPRIQDTVSSHLSTLLFSAALL